MKLTSYISSIGRPVAFYPGLKKITKSTTATLFLCQLIYWEGKQSDKKDRWIYKESSEIEEETGLTYDEQVTARKKLIALGFIEEVYKRINHKMAFRVNLDKINGDWDEYHGIAETPDPRKPKHPIGEQDNTGLGKAETWESLNSNTENTSENTSESDQNDKQPFRILFDRFILESGIPELMLMNPANVKNVNKWVDSGITEENIIEAVKIMKDNNYTISRTASINTTLNGVKSKSKKTKPKSNLNEWSKA